MGWAHNELGEEISPHTRSWPLTEEWLFRDINGQLTGGLNPFPCISWLNLPGGVGVGGRSDPRSSQRPYLFRARKRISSARSPAFVSHIRTRRPQASRPLSDAKWVELAVKFGEPETGSRDL